MAIATLLILNSHLEAFYPRPWLAADGLMGINMFYCLSGYRIASGKSIDSGFWTFVGQRAVRIYPALWLILIVDGLIRGFNGGMSSTVARYVWPTDFTYLYCILPFYLVLFVLNRLLGRASTAFGWVLVLTLIGWVAVVFSSPVTPHSFGDVSKLIFVFYYFSAFMTGAVVARGGFAERHRCPWWLPALLVPGYFLTKMWVVFGRHWGAYALVHLLGALIALSVCWFCADKGRFQWLRANSLCSAVVGFLSEHSFEIYLSHLMILGWYPIYRLDFPVGLLAIFALAMLAAWGLKKATKMPQLALESLISKRR